MNQKIFWTILVIVGLGAVSILGYQAYKSNQETNTLTPIAENETLPQKKEKRFVVYLASEEGQTEVEVKSFDIKNETKTVLKKISVPEDMLEFIPDFLSSSHAQDLTVFSTTNALWTLKNNGEITHLLSVPQGSIFGNVAISPDGNNAVYGLVDKPEGHSFQSTKEVRLINKDGSNDSSLFTDNFLKNELSKVCNRSINNASFTTGWKDINELIVIASVFSPGGPIEGCQQALFYFDIATKKITFSKELPAEFYQFVLSPSGNKATYIKDKDSVQELYVLDLKTWQSGLIFSGTAKHSGINSIRWSEDEKLIGFRTTFKIGGDPDYYDKFYVANTETGRVSFVTNGARLESGYQYGSGSTFFMVSNDYFIFSRQQGTQQSYETKLFVLNRSANEEHQIEVIVSGPATSDPFYVIGLN